MGHAPQQACRQLYLDAALSEAALFIEWSAKQVPQPLLLDLAPLQRELWMWRRVWPQEALRPLLSLQSRHLSDRLLRLAQLTPGA